MAKVKKPQRLASNKELAGLLVIAIIIQMSQGVGNILSFTGEVVGSFLVLFVVYGIGKWVYRATKK